MNAPKPELNAVSNNPTNLLLTQQDHLLLVLVLQYAGLRARSFRVWRKQNFVDVGDLRRISPKSSDLLLLRGRFRSNVHEY